MRFYAQIGRWLYVLVKPTFRFFPRTRRVRCLVIDGSNILLVKNWLGRGQWTLPGGGVHSSETIQLATRRELHEELRVLVDSDKIRLLGDWDESTDGMSCSLELCSTPLKATRLRYNHLELVACEWFELRDLPADRTAVVDEALRRYPHSSRAARHGTIKGT